MKLSFPYAFFLGASTLACGTTTEPVREAVRESVGPRPSAVSIVDALTDNGTAAITFTQTNSAAAASVQYQLTCESASGKLTATGKVSPITITGLTNAVRYSCTVTAIDTNGSSDPSTPVLITPGPPLYEASMFFLLTPGNGSATVSYDLPLPFSGPAPWFVAVSCTAAGSPPVTTTAVHSVVGFITITGLQNGVTYSCAYRITSASGVAMSKHLDVVPGTPVRPLAPKATPGNASVTLSFEPSADNGHPVNGYTATCGATGQESRTVSGASSPLVITGLANSVAYSCNVYGSNALGAGQKSASMTVIPGIPAPLKAVTATTTSNSATFAFSPPDSDNGAPITSYTITCDPFGPGAFAQSSGTSSPMTLSGLYANRLYQCALFATNANGNGAITYVGVATKP